MNILSQKFRKQINRPKTPSEKLKTVIKFSRRNNVIDINGLPIREYSSKNPKRRLDPNGFEMPITGYNMQFGED